MRVFPLPEKRFSPIISNQCSPRAKLAAVSRALLLGVLTLAAQFPLLSPTSAQADEGRVINPIRFGRGELVDAVREQVGQCCGNPPGHTSLNFDFQCAQGAAAASCLQGLVSGLQEPTRRSFRSFIQELPPRLRERMGTLCGRYTELSEQAVCAKDLMRLEDPEVYDAVLDSRVDINDIEDAIERWGVNEQKYSLLSLACERALGHYRVVGTGGNQRLQQTAPAHAACNAHAPLPDPNQIPFQPTAAAARALLRPAPAPSRRPRPAPSASAPVTPRPSNLPASAPSASPSAAANAAPSGRPFNLLFDAVDSRGIPAFEIQCPSYLPRAFCGGGQFDPTRYRRDFEPPRNALARNHDFLDTPREVFRYDSSTGYAGHPLSADSDGASWLQSVYGVTTPLFETEMRDFLLGLFAERALQASALSGKNQPGDLEALQGRILEASSCSVRMREKVPELTQELNRATRAHPEASDRLDQYRNQATLGAACLKAVRSRWQALQHELGADIQVGRPILSDAEIAELPAGVRHLTRGVTSLPILRQFLREMPTMNGFREQQQAPCSLLQDRFNPTITVEARDRATSAVQSWTMSRRSYCMNAYSEYVLMAQEAQSLANAYPALMIPDESGTPGYERIARAFPGGGPSEIRGYDLDSNRRSSRELKDPAGDGPAFCMTRLRDPSAAPSGGPAPMKRAPQAARAELDRTLSSGPQSATSSMIESLLTEARNLCDPSKLHDAVTATLRSPELMQAYFDCNRRHFGGYLATLSVPMTQWPGALSESDCRDRTNSSWLACRLYKDREAEKIRGEIQAGLLTATMDALFFAAPGIGAVSSSASRVVASMAFGGAIGGAMGGLLTSGADAQAAAPEFQAATFLSGYAPIDAYEAAIQRLVELRRHDPRTEAILDGVFMGSAFGAMGSGHLPTSTPRQITEQLLSDAQVAAQTESRLIQTYRNLRSSGALAGAEGAAVDVELQHVFDQTLRRRFPNVPESAWVGMSVDAKIAILEGRFLPPGAEGASYVSAARREEILATRPAQRMIHDYREFRAIGTRENAAYVDLVNGRNPLSSQVKLYFEVENSVLKSLNDAVFVSKDASNAAVNLFKTILDRKLRNDPVLRRAVAARYSDYKSMRLALLSDSPEVLEALRRAYSESATEFAQALRDSPLYELVRGRPGILGDPASWNLAGVGRTADEASLAARTTRSQVASGGTPLLEFSHTRAFLDERLATVEQMRASLQRDIPTSTGIMRESTRTPGRMILSEDAIDAVRKAKGKTYDETISVLRSRLERRFGTTLTDAQVRQIYEYATFGDSLSPSVVQVERTVIDLGHARHGIVSVDISGLGGRNLAETLDAAAAAGPHADRAVALARDSFGRVSGELDQLRVDFAQALDRTLGNGTGRRTLFSGDDGILMPARDLTAEQRLQLVRELGKHPTPSRFRMTFVPQTYAEGGVIPAAQRSLRVVEAESFEKAIRESLEGRIPREEAGRLLVAIDAHPSAAGGGSFDLLIGYNGSAPLSEATRRAVEEAYRAALPKGFSAGALRWP